MILTHLVNFFFGGASGAGVGAHVTAPPATVTGSGTVAIVGTGDVTAPAAAVTGGVTPPSDVPAGVFYGQRLIRPKPAAIRGVGAVAAAAARVLGIGSVERRARLVVVGSGAARPAAARMLGHGEVTSPRQLALERQVAALAGRVALLERDEARARLEHQREQLARQNAAALSLLGF